MDMIWRVLAAFGLAVPLGIVAASAVELTAIAWHLAAAWPPALAAWVATLLVVGLQHRLLRGRVLALVGGVLLGCALGTGLWLSVYGTTWRPLVSAEVDGNMIEFGFERHWTPCWATRCPFGPFPIAIKRGITPWVAALSDDYHGLLWQHDGRTQRFFAYYGDHPPREPQLRCTENRRIVWVAAEPGVLCSLDRATGEFLRNVKYEHDDKEPLGWPSTGDGTLQRQQHRYRAIELTEAVQMPAPVTEDPHGGVLLAKGPKIAYSDP